MSRRREKPSLGEPGASGPDTASPRDRLPENDHADQNSPLSVISVYLPTAAACTQVLSALGADAQLVDAQGVEVPGDYYEALLRSPMVVGIARGHDRDSTDARGRRLCRGTLTYAQALAVARGGRVLGVRVVPGTGRITTDCPCGLGFAVGYARARWAGADDDKAIAQALAWQLATDDERHQAGVGGLIAARLRGDAGKASTLGSAAAGIARSPAGRSTMDAALGAARSLTGRAGSALAGAPMRVNPVVSTLTAVVNLDLYRAALARSISWQQFTKNLMVKTSGAVTAAGGWVTGAAAGSVVGGPIGALIGGLLGAAGGGTAGAFAAKQVADRLVPEDAERLLAIVREVTEAAACEHLLLDAELETLAARLTERVTPAWLRKLYREGHDDNGGTWHAAAVRERAAREVRQLCQAIVARRTPIEPPSMARVEAVLAHIDAAARQTRSPSRSP